MLKLAFFPLLMMGFFASTAQALIVGDIGVLQIREKAASIFPKESGFTFSLDVDDNSVDMTLIKGAEDSLELRKIYNYIVRQKPSLADQILLSNAEAENACSLGSSIISWSNDENCGCWCKRLREATRRGLLSGDDCRECSIVIIVSWFQQALKASDGPLDVLSYEFKEHSDIRPFLNLVYKALQDIF